MTTPVRAVAFLLLLSPVAGAQTVNDGMKVHASDWPWWRGPSRNGVAAPGQKPPLTWGEKENVIWKTPVPGRGHGSPIVVGDQVILATADAADETQSLISFDRKTGQKKWRTVLHQGGFINGANAKASNASSTPASDGERIFINFPTHGAIFASAVDLDGKKLWQTKVTGYTLHQGYGASPAVYQSLVLIGADNKGAGAIAGLDRKTGEIVWKVDRPKTPNYASPIILNIAGRDQAIFTGCNHVTSLDPLTGKTIWEVAGSTTECVTSPVTDGKHVFTSGGYPKNHVSAVTADGSAKVVWEVKNRIYVPSMIVTKGHLFGVMDAGMAVCWKPDTGEEVWKERIEGTFSSSPVLVNDLMLATNEAGRTYVFKADPTKFELIGENELGNNVFATPVVCGNQIFHRVGHQTKGQRDEYLYCLGTKSAN